MQVIDRQKALSIPPIFRLGFRPLFLGAALFALLAIPLWLISMHTGSGFLHPTGGWMAWHRHEMPFGFGLAVIGGFLLTAVQNWTGQPGLSGRPLAALAGVWLAARIGWLAGLPAAWLLPLELAFPLLVSAAIARILWSVRMTRNYPVVGVLGLLAAADALSVIGVMRSDDGLQRQGALAALWLIAGIVTLIGGRVTPFFTIRGLRRPGNVPPTPRLDNALLGGAVLMAVLEASGAALSPHPLIGAVLLALAAGHWVRLWRWFDRGIGDVPLLWSLHLAYAWLPVACLGLAGWHAGAGWNPSLPLHALTVGTIGGLILAMMARVSLGHTGRDLEPPRGMAAAFALLQAGAACRVFVAGVWPGWGWWLAGLCWMAAFGVFAWRYAPMLWSARVDGHPG